jgi:hypothetical protein
MARSSLIALATFGSVGTAALISIVWFAASSGDGLFEPAVGLLGILGGLTGILAERRAAANDRRKAIRATLRDELNRATTILAGTTFAPTDTPHAQVYPRLPLSAVDAALTSGVLLEPADTELLNQLHQWRDEVNGFHRRLELTETRVFAAGATHDATDLHRALHRQGGYLDHIRDRLAQLFMLVEPTTLRPRTEREIT